MVLLFVFSTKGILRLKDVSLSTQWIIKKLKCNWGMLGYIDLPIENARVYASRNVPPKALSLNDLMTRYAGHNIYGNVVIVKLDDEYDEADADESDISFLIQELRPVKFVNCAT